MLLPKNLDGKNQQTKTTVVYAYRSDHISLKFEFREKGTCVRWHEQGKALRRSRAGRIDWERDVEMRASGKVTTWRVCRIIGPPPLKPLEPRCTYNRFSMFSPTANLSRNYQVSREGCPDYARREVKSFPCWLFWPMLLHLLNFLFIFKYQYFCWYLSCVWQQHGSSSNHALI